MAATAEVVLTEVFPITFIPNTFDLSKGSWFDAAHPFHRISVHFLAAAHPLRLDLQNLAEQIVMAGNDVHEIVDTSRRMVGAVPEDMGDHRNS